MPITINVSVTGETPEDVRAQFADVLTKPLADVVTKPTLASSEAAPTADEVDVLRVNDAWAQVGPKIRNWLAAAARKENGWKNEDLAAELGIDATTIRSHAANLGRTMKIVNKRHGTSGRLYFEKGNGYAMSDTVRQAILAKADGGQSPS